MSSLDVDCPFTNISLPTLICPGNVDTRENKNDPREARLVRHA